MLIVAMSCKMTSIDTRPKEIYQFTHFIPPGCWWTTVFCSQSNRHPVWSGLICWAASEEAHFSNGKATHWYKRTDFCLASCHARELVTRNNTYVRLYITMEKISLHSHPGKTLYGLTAFRCKEQESKETNFWYLLFSGVVFRPNQSQQEL